MTGQEQDRAAISEPTYPSGLFPWVVCGLGGLFFSYGYFQRVAPSVMVAELMGEFGVGAAVLGNLGALFFYAYAVMQLPAGVMLDRWGPRRVLPGAIVFCALGCWVFATADGIAQAYVGRLMIGTGAGFSWVGALKLTTLWFPVHRFAVHVDRLPPETGGRSQPRAKGEALALAGQQRERLRAGAGLDRHRRPDRKRLRPRH